MRFSSYIAAILSGVLALGAFADWPQFLGPDRNGVAPERNLARQWPPEGPRVLWTVQLGAGFGGAAIRDGRVFVLDRVEDSRDVLRVFDLLTGRELWSHGYEAAGRTGYNGSRTTPVVDDRFVFTTGPFGHIHCIDRETHRARWSKHLIEDYGTDPAHWGFGQSPLLYKDMLIIAPLSRSAGVVALDKAKGFARWQSPPIGGKSGRHYSSPLVTSVDGTDQVVIVSKPSAVGIDVAHGDVLWRYDGHDCRIPIPAPTPVGDGRFFITGGYNAGSVMIQVRHVQGRFESTELFRLPDLGSIIANAVLVNGYLYANFNTKNKHDGLACIDLKGNVLWQTRQSVPFEKGNMIAADGMIYLLGGQTGVLYLIEAIPSGYKQLASAKLLGGSNVWAPLALSDGKLVIRDQMQMKCVEVR